MTPTPFGGTPPPNEEPTANSAGRSGYFDRPVDNAEMASADLGERIGQDVETLGEQVLPDRQRRRKRSTLP